MTIKVGLTGATGKIGQELLKYPNFFPLVGDVRNPSEIEMAVRSTKPDLIVHLAFISDVDFCQDKNNLSHATNVNIRGTFNVCEVALQQNCPIVFMSSDHVFDGLWGNYKEKNKPHPKNTYGLMKMACEGFQKIFPNLKVVRTSYLLTNERIEQEVENIKAGHDYPTFMYRSFMPLRGLGHSLSEYCQRIDEMPNILHISGSKTVSWYEYAKYLASVAGLDSSTIFPRTKELPGFTPRPKRSGLNVSLSNHLELPQYSYKDI